MPRKGGVPENLKPWPKGVSGNPKGGPPGPKAKTKLISAWLLDLLDEVDPKSGKSNSERIARAVLEKARRAEPFATSTVLERLEGKVGAKLEVSVDLTAADAATLDARLARLAAAAAAGEDPGEADPE